MGHRQFGLRLGATLNAKSAELANKIRNTDSLALDVLPKFRVHCASFELNDPMAQALQILRHVSATHGSKGYLPEKAGVGLEG